MIVNEPIDYMLNAHKYNTVPARHFGECDEQYKKRFKAYSLGLEKGAASRQAEIDELKRELEILQGMHNAVSLTAGDLVDERDELQMRIDDALVQISNHYHSCVARKELKRMSAPVSEISEIEAHESNMCVLENILKGEKQ